jgi:hypothetical protein
VCCLKTALSGLYNRKEKNEEINTYAARKLKLQTTGNADGAGFGPSNFYLVPGETPPEKIISSLDNRLNPYQKSTRQLRSTKDSFPLILRKMNSPSSILFIITAWASSLSNRG